MQGLGRGEGGVEDGTCGREVAGFEEIRGEAIGRGLKSGDGAVAEGTHVDDCV